MASPLEMLTDEGYDLQFGTNVIGHFLFTKLLMPTLLETVKEAGEARVVNVSSLGHLSGPPGGIDWDSVRPGAESMEARKRLGVDKLYYQSKCVRIPGTYVCVSLLTA